MRRLEFSGPRSVFGSDAGRQRALAADLAAATARPAGGRRGRSPPPPPTDWRDVAAMLYSSRQLRRRPTICSSAGLELRPAITTGARRAGPCGGAARPVRQRAGDVAGQARGRPGERRSQARAVPAAGARKAPSRTAPAFALGMLQQPTLATCRPSNNSPRSSATPETPSGWRRSSPGCARRRLDRARDALLLRHPGLPAATARHRHPRGRGRPRASTRPRTGPERSGRRAGQPRAARPRPRRISIGPHASIRAIPPTYSNLATLEMEAGEPRAPPARSSPRR